MKPHDGLASARSSRRSSPRLRSSRRRRTEIGEDGVLAHVGDGSPVLILPHVSFFPRQTRPSRRCPR
eukprot:5151385-Heterocapsa_arctica.AAC.1